jgi:type IV fimbrial biogenesis protein FimT
MSMKKSSGFTLVELMIVVVIAVVLAVAAVPLGNLVRSNANTSHINEIASAVNFARSSAVTNGGNVIICTIEEGDYGVLSDDNDANNADVDCLNSDDWSQGWMVFLDTDDDGSLNNDPLLAVHEPLPDNYTLTASLPGLAWKITFSSTGRPSVIGNWKLCDPSNDENIAKAIYVSRTGRIRFHDQGDALACPE